MSFCCRTNKYISQVYFKRIFRRFCLMPIYAIIFKSLKAGTIADNWDVARTLRDGTPNSYAKKFPTTSEAENYIKEMNFKITGNNDGVKGVKRKRIEIPSYSPIDSIKEHIKKTKIAFNDLQLSVASFSGLPPACKGKLKVFIEDVFDNIYTILNIDKPESLAVTTTDSADGKNCSSTSINVNPDIDDPDDASLTPSEIDRAKNLFQFNDKNEVIVYTDGACSKNGYKGAAAGAGVWFGQNHPLNLSVRLLGAQTNNNAEIFSVVRAIDRVKITGLKKVNIHTDSEYVMNSINNWMPRWEKNGWKTASGAAVKNKEIFMTLQKKIQTMDSVSWTHVRGHAGITGNEEADKLAKAGAAMA